MISKKTCQKFNHVGPIQMSNLDNETKAISRKCQNVGHNIVGQKFIGRQSFLHAKPFESYWNT